MKKSLLALAVFAAFAGAAQADVTIYGQIEASVSNVNDGTTAMSGIATPTSQNLAKGNATSVNGLQSRLGFKGEEKLGNGTTAFFNFEHRLDTATGASTTGTFWQGRSVVGLKNADLGELALGRDYSPAFAVAASVDPFRFDGTVGQVSNAHLFAGYKSNDGGFRINNGVFYRSPSLANFSVALAAGAGEGVANTEYAGSLSYASGPLAAAVAYDKTGDNDLTLVGGSYDFGFVKPMISYSKSKVAGVKSSNFSLGGTAPLFHGVVKFAVAELNPEGADNNTTKFSVGYEYGLSKRTAVFADIGTAKKQAATRTTGYDVGLRHKF